MREIVKNILEEILEIKEVDEQLLNRETNEKWDSLKHLEIIMALEEEFKIRFTLEEIKKINNLEDICTYLFSKEDLMK